MKKQEVIEKLKQYGAWCTECHDINGVKDRYVKVAKVRELIEQIDEPQAEKVEVPDFVAEWYESHENNLNQAIYDATIDSYDHRHKTEFEEWFIDSRNDTYGTLIRMKDGYTVKPKRWIVRLDNGRYVNDFQEAKFCVGIGITLEMDCLPPFKFTDKAKAEAVATLIDGEVEEV